ncbi:hypothetical protein [Oceaniglobus trochenteri]|uniref:hypothetical protein n=1 Tax=Oceaniglobus trochenteri TaxID=2763260 RepID=UPI001CFF6C67|nr:hypothetical protein [Oceaniglobus trochenteri]
MSRPTPPPLPVSLRRIALRVLVLALLAWGIHMAMGLAGDVLALVPQEHQGGLRLALVLSALVLYALLIAVPFVPGVELALMLMWLGGAQMAPAVYVFTLAGLLMAYLAGRFLPLHLLRRFFLDLRLVRACALIDRVAPLSRPRRLALLRQNLPRRLGGLAVRCRYVTLAVLLNIPGNALIGGGGGICLVAGLSGLFGLRAMALTLAVVVLPVPLAVWVFGPSLIASPL